MPTDKRISDIYKKMNQREKLEKSIPQRSMQLFLGELHSSSDYPVHWD